jgi:alanyl-tRNA synthetase
MLAIWEPLEKVYALSDHARCLAFMLGDGIVPSNVKAGYLTRMVIRKCLRMMDDLGLKLSLYDVVDVQLKAFKGDFPELSAHRDYIKLVLDLETERYTETLEKGRRLVEREAKAHKGKPFPVEKLIDLYDSQGLSPEIVKAVAEPLGVIVDVPDDFYSAVANKHAKASAEEQEDYTGAHEDARFATLAPTRALFYEDSTMRDFDANVVWAEGDLVALDATAFYAEGGGQPADKGILHTGGHGAQKGPLVEVLDVQKYATLGGHVIVHKVKQPGALKKGDKLHGHVDWDLRTGHTRHHTATHLILASAKQVLGFHTWQGGAQKGYDRSRVDIQHFARITDEQLRRIEELANQAVLDDRPVEKVWMPRDVAEKRFGMQLYQGGVPKGREVRVVTVKAPAVSSGHGLSAAGAADLDVECCGGTHVVSTSDVGPIKILRSERIQDGLERIEFSAGMAAIKQMQRKDELLKQAAEAFSVQVDDVPKTAQRFFDEWKQLRKENETLKARLAELEAKSFSPQITTEVEGHKVAIEVKDLDAALIRTLAQEYAKAQGHAVAVVNLAGVFVVAGPGAVAVAKKLAAGKAGGKPDLAQGSIADFAATQTQQAVEKLRQRLS